MIETLKYAYFIVNDSDDLEELQSCIDPFGGIEQMKNVFIDYALDRRRIIDLIKICNEGDIIYISHLSRLGKSLKALYRIVSIANERKVVLNFCDNINTSFRDININGQINLACLQWAVELEESIKSENIKAVLSKKKYEIERTGTTINKKGLFITHWGNEKGTDETKRIMSIAREASCQAKIEAAISWRENSQAVRFAVRKHSEGWTVTQIAEELGKLFDENPTCYGTSTGCKPSKGTVSKWLKEAETSFIPRKS